MASGSSDVRDDEEDVVINGDDKPSDAGLTLSDLFRRAFSTVFNPSDPSSSTFLLRARTFVSENAPLVKDASANSGRMLMLWTRRGSRFRALLVISVGTIVLLSLTGLLVFMLFFLAATINAIVISLLMSLAAAGGFLAFFFVCVTAIYVGALSIAVVIISAATISAIIAAVVATGWIGFLWCVWLVTQKSFGVLKHSATITSSAISTYTSSRRSSVWDAPPKLD